MTKEQNERLGNALDALYHSKEMQELKDLVIELADSEDCNGGCYNIFPDVERKIDDIATTAGWIYDRLNGKPKRGMGKLQKIRKALGYTYP